MTDSTPATAAPWWERLWQRIDRWLIETQRLCEMDDDDRDVTGTNEDARR